MCAEKFFAVEVLLFSLFLAGYSGSVWCFWRCLLLVCGAFQHSLWCGSMLVGVTFAHVEWLCG